MDDAYGLSTPEQVELRLDVAGLGSRFLAGLTDALIQGGVMIALLVAAILSGVLVDRLGASGSTASTVMLSLAVLAIFVVIWGYYIFFEMVWNGQTPGKRLAGLRVLTSGGHPITLAHSLIRNLVRIVDFLPSSYMLGAVVILLNRRSQRLGDLAAGTIVVKERREAAPRSLDLTVTDPLAPQQAAAFLAEDVALAREFLLRRSGLAPSRRRELAERISRRLRARLDGAALEAVPTADVGPDEELIARVAALRR